MTRGGGAAEDDVIFLGTKLIKILKKTGFTVSPVRWDTYFLVNRVENQKLNQTTAELPFGLVFGFQLGPRQTVTN